MHPRSPLRNELLRNVTGAGAPPRSDAPAAGSMAPKYQAFCEFIRSDPRFIAVLGHVIDVKMHDHLQDLLVGLCNARDMLKVIMCLLSSEFERKALKEPGSILRGASLAAKMSSRHARNVSTKYLSELFRDWVKSLQDLDELNVENENDKEKLNQLCLSILQHISKDESVANIPEDVRQMARLIGSLCDKYLPDQKWPLIGGLMLLRLYCPTIISPTTYGVLPTDQQMSPAFRKNLMQVTRLLQNASNHQPFKEGPNVALNDWIEKHGSDIDAFLEKVITSEVREAGSQEAEEVAPKQPEENIMLQLVQTFVQNKNKINVELETWPAEDKEAVTKFSDLLSACGNPFRTRTGTVAKASESLGLSLGTLQAKRFNAEDLFKNLVEEYKGAYMKDYFSVSDRSTVKDKTVRMCTLLSNDKHGVACVPKIGKSGNHLVFEGREAVDWIAKNLGITDRTGHAVQLVQDMVDMELVLPYQAEKKDKKGGVKFEDGDRQFWFDYAKLTEAKVKYLGMSHSESQKSLLSIVASSSSPPPPPPGLIAQGAQQQQQQQSPPPLVAEPPATPETAEVKEAKAGLASVHIDKLGAAGVLNSAKPPNGATPGEEVSSKEQWRMIVVIAWSMIVSPIAVTASASEREEVRLSEADIDTWLRKYLGFKIFPQTQEMIGIFVSDGIANEVKGTSVHYTFSKLKIKQWHEKAAVTSRTPRTSMPTLSKASPPPMQGQSSKGSLRGSLLSRASDQTAEQQQEPKKASSAATVSRTSAKEEIPSSPKGDQPRPPERAKSAVSLTSAALTVPSSGPSGRSPSFAVEAASSEEEDDGKDVSMLDFLNTDPDEVNGNNTNNKQQPATKKKSFLGRFGKKDDKPKSPDTATPPKKGGFFKK